MDLRVFLKLDGSGFTQGLTSARQAVGRFGTQAFGGLKNQIAGAFTIGAVTALSKRTMDAAGRIQDLSERLGVSTDFLQEFRYVAKQTGTDLEALTSVMETLNKTRDTALSGGKAGQQMLQNYAALGISESDLRTQRWESMISNQVVRAFERGDVQGRLGAAWRAVGGRGAGELVQAFTEGFNEQRAKAHTAGKVWSEEQIQILDEMGDTLAIFGDRLLVEWGGILISMVEMTQRLGAKIERILNFYVGGTAEWTRKDWEQKAIQMISPFATPGPEFDTSAARQTAEKFDTEFRDEMANIAEARARARANKAQRRAGVEISPVALEEEKIKKAREPKSDSLISVGNFLGAGRGTIESLYKESLQVQRLSLKEIQQTNRLLARIPFFTIES